MTKSTIMKKLLPLILFVALAGSSFAQSVSFTVVTPPCNNNGILKAYFSGLTPPITVRWVTQGTTGGTIMHTGVTALNDILTSYSGGPLTVYASDTLHGLDTGYFAGNAPFSFNLYGTPGICPALDTAID